MSKNKIGEDSPIPKFLYLKIRRQDGVEFLTPLRRVSSRCPLTAALVNITIKLMIEVSMVSRAYVVVR